MPTNKLFTNIDRKVSRGRQDVTLLQFATVGAHKVRIEVKSDSYKFQCYAHLSVLDKEKMAWNPVVHIPHGQMHTPEGVCYQPDAREVTAHNQSTLAAKYFGADVNELIRIYKALID
jgi:hypothetical protein